MIACYDHDGIECLKQESFASNWSSSAKAGHVCSEYLGEWHVDNE